MKIVLLTILTLLITMTISGCKKTEYKHPLHRSQGK